MSKRLFTIGEIHNTLSGPMHWVQNLLHPRLQGLGKVRHQVCLKPELVDLVHLILTEPRGNERHSVVFDALHNIPRA